MKSLSNKLAYTVGAAAVSLFAVAAPATAASVIYDIEVNLDSGFLSGETFTGFFEFDDSGLTGSGEEYLAVSDLSFDFNGDDFTEDDGNPEVLFFDGDFLGLEFSTDAAFSFVPGFFDLSEAEFFYDVPDQVAGAGDVVYTLRDDSGMSVPEPASALALLAVGALGASSTLRHKRA